MNKKVIYLLAFSSLLSLTACNQVEPTQQPTVEPTVEPTIEPTVEPTAEPGQ